MLKVSYKPQYKRISSLNAIMVSDIADVYNIDFSSYKFKPFTGAEYYFFDFLHKFKGKKCFEQV